MIATAEDTCQICQGRHTIACPEHMVRVDADGWCLRCDTCEPDARDARVNCTCQE